MDSPLCRRALVPAEDRAIILERAAVEAAQAWAHAYLAELALEGRPVEGGWPGTMSEARTRVAAGATRALAVRKMTSLTPDELGRFAQNAYAEARRAWLRSSKDGARKTARRRDD